MTSLNHTLAAATAALVVLVTTGCPDGGPGSIIDTPGFNTCTESEQCPQGHVCSAGGCVLGTCDPLLEQACDVDGLESKYCCKPWELCSSLSFTCDNDPDVRGIGCAPDDESCTPCELQDDCAAGQFCSGAACFDATGRAGCTSSFQCPSGERCDRNVFLCVPDRGGCTFCGPDFPELCCEDGQVCSEQTGFCEEIPQAECDPQAADDGCPAGLFCDELSRCVQCVDDGDCGPNLACDEGAGTCFPPSSVCETDADCLGNKRCALSLRQCVGPECESDADCRVEDGRSRCDVGLFKCFLPPAVCTETDEENDSAATAVAMTNGVSYGGVLCRGDADFLSFPVQPNKRYTATVTLATGNRAGISVVMLDTSLVVESSATFPDSGDTIQLAGVTGESESGNFYVKVTGNNVDRDQWSYSVTIAEDEPSVPADCTEAGQAEEPNDDFEHATALVPGETRVLSRCGTADVDFYRVPVSALHGVHVVVGGFHNAEGNINVELFKAPDATSRVDQGISILDEETVDGPEGPSEYFIKVQLGAAAGALGDQSYSITATEVPRPPECAADINENDGILANATALTLAPDAENNLVVSVPDIIRCNPQDVDLFRFSMPPNLGGAVLLSFEHSQGDMALDLLDASGTQIDTSNVSNSATDPDEQITIPGHPTDTVDYIIRARLAGTSGGTLGQRYNLEVVTFDDAQCIASEPVGSDDTFADGRCIGTAASYDGSAFPCDALVPEPLLPDCGGAPAGTAGCGRTCGNSDSDFYRVGALKKQQVLHAVLTFTQGDGALDLVRHAVNVGGTNPSTTTTTDTNGTDGRVEFSFVETGTTLKEYGVSVRPKGGTGHQLQPYTLHIEVGPECTDDANDEGTASNEKPATATTLARSSFTGTPRTRLVEASRCVVSATVGDIDVYELILLEGEDLIVELDQADPTPGGLQAEIGQRPADLNQIPPAAATALAGGAPQTFTSTSDQTVYITVRPPTGTVVTGPYTLTATID